MGLWDEVKSIGGDVGGAFVDAGKAVAAPVADAAGAGWDFLNEWGDKDYTPATDAGAAARAEQQTNTQIDSALGGGLSPEASQILGDLSVWEQRRGVTKPQGLEIYSDNPYTMQQQLMDRGVTWTGQNQLQADMWGEQAQRWQEEFASAAVDKEMTKGLTADLDNLLGDEPDYEKLNNERLIAQNVIALLENSKDDAGNVTDPDMFGAAQVLMNQHQQLLQPQIDVLQPGWFEENFVLDEGQGYFGKAAGKVGSSLLTAGGAVLNVLDMMSKDVLESIAVSGIDPDTGLPTDDSLFSPGMWRGVGRGLKNLIPGVDYDTSNYDNLTDEEGNPVTFEEFVDKNQSGGIGFREAIGSDADAGGFLGDVADFAATAVTDPLSWVGVGAAARTKSVMQGTARWAAEGGEEAMQRHATIWSKVLDPRQGYKKLDDLERAELNRWIHLDARDAAQARGAGLTGKAREAWERNLRRADDKLAKLDKDIEKIGSRNLDAVQNAGGGVRIGGASGANVPGTRFLSRPFYRKPQYETVTELRDLGRRQTMRRAEPVFGTQTRTEAVPGAAQFRRTTRVVQGDEVAEGLVDDALDPRIEFLRRKAESTDFPEEADAFFKKIDDLREKLRAKYGGDGAHTNISYADDYEMVAQGIRYIDEVVQTGQKWVEDVLPVLDEYTWQRVIRHDPALINRLPRFTKLRRALVPRFDMGQKIGKAQAQGVRKMLVEVQGEANMKSADIARRLQGKLGKSVLKEFGGNQEAMDRWLNQALSSADGMLDARLSRVGQTKAGTQVLDAMQDIRNEVWDLMPDDLKPLLNKEGYIPRVMSEEGLERLANLSDADLQKILDLAKNSEADWAPLVELANQVRRERKAGETIRSMYDRHLMKRTIRPDIQDTFELNDAMAKLWKDLDIEFPEQLFETDVLAATAVRARSGYNAKMMADTMTGLSNLGDDIGERLIISADDPAINGANRFRMMRPDQHDFGDFYIHEDLYPSLEEFHSVIRDPNKMKQFAESLDTVQSMWARYATLSPGFHVRNTVGNVFNAFLGGLTNPVRYVDAANLQWNQSRIRRLMGKEGLSFDDAARKLGVRDVDVRMLTDLQKYQLSAGTVGDVFRERHTEPFSMKELKNLDSQSRFNPTTWSRYAGEFIEHNARIALYMDALSKGMAPAQAADHVKTYLFDYGDLTRFEQGVRRYASRFYTFMRKNTALQATVLAQRPGWVHNAQKIVDGFEGVLFGEESDNQSITPGWAQRAGMSLREGGGLVDKVMGREATPGIVGIESPFFAAIGTVEDLQGLFTGGAEWLGLDSDWVPESLQDTLFYENGQQRIGAALGLFSGVPKVAADIVYGQATGYDPFTGAVVGFSDLEEKGEKPNGMIQLAGFLNPAISRVMRWEERLSADDDEVDPVLQFMNIMGGIQFYPDGKAQASAAYQVQEQVRDLLSELPDEALDYEELVRVGRLDMMNRVVYAQAYLDPTDEDGNNVLTENLAGILPRPFLEYMERAQIGGITGDVIENRRQQTLPRYDDEVVNEGELLSDIAILEGAQQAFEELAGRALSPEEKWYLMSLMPSMPNMEDLRNMGIEPGRDWGSEDELLRNPFISDALKPSDEEYDIDVQRTVDMLGSSIGYGFSDATSNHPIFTDVARLLRQYDEAVAAGAVPTMSVEEALAREMTRQEIAVMFGEETLSQFFWQGYDERSAARDQNEGYNDSATARFIFEARIGRTPTEGELRDLVIWMNMGKTDQKALVAAGWLPGLGVFPDSRTNMVTDDEKTAGIVGEYNALSTGAQGNRFMGRYPEADPRTTVELGGADWLYGENRFEEAPDWAVTGYQD